MNKRKVLAFALGPVLTALLSLFSLPLIAWYFPPEDIGRNNVFQISISFSILLFVLGLDQAYVREYHEAENRPRLFRACFVPGAAALGLILLGTLPLAKVISHSLYGESRVDWYLLTFFCVFLSFVARFLSLIVRMQERGIAYSVSQALPKLIVICLLCGFILGGAERVFTNLLYANLVSIIFVVLILGWNIRADLFLSVSSRINFDELKKLLKFGVPLIGAGLAYWGLSASSTIALRAFSNFKELGIYSMAVSFAGMALIFQSIFSTIWMPTVYKWVASGENLEKIDIVTGQVASAVCFVFAFAGMFSWIVTLVLPIEYSKIQFLLACCMAQPLLYTLSEATVVGLNIKRKSMYALGVALLALVANAALSVFLVPQFGAAGATVANAIAYCVFFVARTEISARIWRPIERRQMYTVVLCMVFIASWSALTGQKFETLLHVIWVTAFVGLLFLYQSNLKLLFKVLKGSGMRW